jgi:hypothetical protein
VIEAAGQLLWAMNLEVVKGFHGGVVFHCYKNRNCCFNSNESQRDTSPNGTAEQRARCLTRALIQGNGGAHSSRRTENRDLTHAEPLGIYRPRSTPSKIF